MEETTTSLQRLLEIFMHRSMKNFIAYLKARDLSMSHAGALFMLHRRGACGVTEIGEYLGITPAGTSQMLNRLVGDGLIERHEDANDRRVKRIILTVRGKETLQESIHARQTWVEQLIASLEPEERKLVEEALQLLVEKSGHLDPAAVSGPIENG